MAMALDNEINLIGIDLGGTKINAGLVKGQEIIDKNYILIPQQAKSEWEIINIIIDLIKDLRSRNDAIGIGIGVPSILNREKGIIYNVQNIPSWKEVHLADILYKEFGIPVFLDNDANCFALGEYQFGLGKNCKNMVGLTIGTGMGAGIITNGHLISDANGGAGEFGMIQYKDGIFEDYCSGKFFKKQYHLSGEALLNLANQGNLEALDAFEQFGKHLGNAIKAIMYAVDPQKIIIGGSVVKSAKYFDKSLKQTIREIDYDIMLENFEIIYSNTPDIAIMGAISLYYDRMSTV